MRISQKLILGFLTIMLIVGFSGYLSIKISKQSLYDSIGHSLVHLAHETINRIDRSIYYRLEEFLVYAKDLLIKQSLRQSNEQFHQLENTNAYINQKDQEWLAVPDDEVSPFMQSILDGELSQELREIIKFYETEYGYNVVGEIFVTNKYGANVAQTGKTTDYRQDDELWWQKAKQNGFYISDVEYDKSADVYSLDICVRIDNQDGHMLGVLKVVFNIQETIQILKELEQEGDSSGKHKTLAFKLISGQGRYIYTTHAYHVPQSTLEPIQNNIVFDDQEHSYWIEQNGHGKEGEKLLTYATSQGFKKFKGLGWQLVVEKDTKETLVPVDQLKHLLGAILIALIATIAFIAIKSYQAIAIPLKKLEEGIREIKKGNLDVHLETKSDDEIGFLMGSFNTMAQDLNRSRDSLLKRNQELHDNEQSLRQTIDALKKTHEDLKEKEFQLLQSEKLASIGQLAAGVAHEINNPLGFLISNLYSLKEHLTHIKEALQKDPMNKSQSEEVDLDFIIEDVDKILDESQRGAGRMKKIVMDLKTFARGDEDTMELLKLDRVVDSVLDMVHNEMKYKAELKKEYQNVPLIKGNQQRLGQVFVNLLINAVHAIEDKGVIEVKVYQEKQNVCVDIKDTGKGIDKKDLKNIFDPFYSTKPVGQGTGLGLSISYGIVAKHGGEIKVDSEVGVGTTFTIMIPMAEDNKEKV